MSGFDRLPEAAAEVFGEGATATQAYGLLTVDVPAAAWVAALTTARDVLGCTFFDWLSAVDQPGTGFQVCAHVARLAAPASGGDRLSAAGGSSEGDGAGDATGDTPGDRTGGGPASSGAGLGHLLVRTTVPHDAPALPTATGVYPGAAWHERETHEMFGVDFPGHPGLDRLLLPEEFEGHPLRKDFVLAARVAKAWPGAKEPGESHDGGPRRRQMLPPGVPDPNEWGPLKGQLPPAPARPARAGRPAPGAASGAPAERPARRMRTAGQGSASQRAAASGTPQAEPPAAGPAASGDRPGRTTPPRKRVPDAPWERPRDPEPRTPAAPGPASQEAPEPGPGAPESAPQAPGPQASAAREPAPEGRKPEDPKAPGPKAPEPEAHEPEAARAPEPIAPEVPDVPEAEEPSAENPDAARDGDAEGGPR